jgi:hypothetical protein
MALTQEWRNRFLVFVLKSWDYIGIYLHTHTHPNTHTHTHTHIYIHYYSKCSISIYTGMWTYYIKFNKLEK